MAQKSFWIFGQFYNKKSNTFIALYENYGTHSFWNTNITKARNGIHEEKYANFYNTLTWSCTQKSSGIKKRNNVSKATSLTSCQTLPTNRSYCTLRHTDICYHASDTYWLLRLSRYVWQQWNYKLWLSETYVTQLLWCQVHLRLLTKKDFSYGNQWHNWWH